MNENPITKKSNNLSSIKECRVAKILDSKKLVLNVGSLNGITVGQRFLIYGLSDDEIIDPATNKPLGYLELVRGTGSVKYVQDKMCILESDSFYRSFRTVLEEPEPVPFDNPMEGDYAREIQ